MRKYIFINHDIEELREDVKSSRLPFLKRLLDQFEIYEKERLPKLHPAKSTTYMGMACANLALTYLITKQEQYKEQALKWINAVCGYEKWGNAHLVNVDLSASWIMFGLSLAYDWLKDDLDEKTATMIKEKLILQADIMYKYKKKNEGKGWATNYWQNHNWINMTGLAAAGYALKGECDDAQLWIDDSKDNFETVFNLWSDDGSNYEGTVYWRYGAMWLFVYAHLLKNEEGIDYFAKSEMLKNTFYYRLYQATPNLEEVMNYGDCHDRRSSHSTCIYYKVASEYGNGHAQYLANKVRTEMLHKEQYESGVKPGILPEAMFEMLFYDPKVEEKKFTDLPLVKHFDDLGLISLRSSWDEDALMISMKTGHPGGKKQWKELYRLRDEKNISAFGLSHQHPDNNSFIINAYGSYLAIDEGYNRHVKASEHNVMTIDGKGYPVENVNNVLGESAKKIEEQGFNPLTDYIAEIESYSSKDGITSFTGEAAKMYDKSLNLDRYARTISYTERGYFIMLDEMRSSDAHTYTWNMHSDTVPVKVSDKEFDYSNGLAKMKLTNIFPEDTKISHTETYVKAVMTTQEPDNYRETFMKTIQIENTKKEKDIDFLNILVPRRFYENDNLKIEKIKYDNTIGVKVIGNNFEDLFLFSKSGKINFENIKEDASIVIVKYDNKKEVSRFVK